MTGRLEAERWLSIAEKLLAARDLVGSKEFAERALDSFPLLAGVDQILAVADVLLAAQCHVNNQINWYSILNLDPSSTPASIKRHYRRLALLLNPDHNKSPGADAAFKLVVDAWAVLADPSKKALFDAELKIAAGAPDPAAFWTSCPSCCHVYQYATRYLDRTLRCPTCHKPFRAAAISTVPPIVPGTDMYYCSWGFFPLGFPGGPESSWKPFYPMSQCWGNQPAQAAVPQADGGGGTKENVNVTVTPVRNRKRMARKKVVSKFQKSEAGAQPPPEPAGVNIVQEEKVVHMDEEGGVGGEEVEVNDIAIDLDAPGEVLGKVGNVVLKDEEIEIPKEN